MLSGDNQKCLAIPAANGVVAAATATCLNNAIILRCEALQQGLDLQNLDGAESQIGSQRDHMKPI